MSRRTFPVAYNLFMDHVPIGQIYSESMAEKFCLVLNTVAALVPYTSAVGVVVPIRRHRSAE